jgi:hypothetical protein
MQPTMRMTRILVFLLLILRLVAAPISARKPEGQEAGSKNAGFTVRVCKWPAQRLDRSTVSSIAVARKPGLMSGVQTPIFCGGSRSVAAFPIFICPFHQSTAPAQDLSARRRVDSPRC